MLKIMGAILLVFSTTAIGFSLSNRLHNRCKYLSDFISFISNLSVQIRYNSLDIQSAVESSLSANSATTIFAANQIDNTPFISKWNTYIDGIGRKSGIKKEDKKLMRDFGINLGNTDTQGQLTNLKLYQQLFNTNLEKAKNEVEKKSKLYRVLGFSIGTAIAIIIL